MKDSPGNGRYPQDGEIYVKEEVYRVIFQIIHLLMAASREVIQHSNLVSLH
jgi:hypothetical protein